MNIDLTKKEFSTLLEAIGIADWILTAFKIDENPKTTYFQKTFQKIYSCAKEAGLDHLVQYDKQINKYFASALVESKTMPYIKEFENETFWDELIDRLSEKEIIAQIGEKSYKKFGIDEYFDIELPIREKYSNEFEKNGIDNLVVIFEKP